MKEVFLFIITISLVFGSAQAFAQELPLPEGKNVKEWEAISVALVAEDRFEEAVLYLDKILEKDPENLKAMSNKAGLLIQLGKFDESLNLSNNVLQKEPERVSTLINKALAQKNLKQYDEAYVTFSQIISIEPDNEKVKNARAELLSNSPTTPTTGSKYDVHLQLIIRDKDGNLVAVTESKNARYLPGTVTEKYWDRLTQEGYITISDGKEIFTTNEKLNWDVDHVSFVALEREMSGHTVSFFEVFLPMIQIDNGDQSSVKWTIIKK